MKTYNGHATIFAAAAISAAAILMLGKSRSIENENNRIRNENISKVMAAIPAANAVLNATYKSAIENPNVSVISSDVQSPDVPAWVVVGPTSELERLEKSFASRVPECLFTKEPVGRVDGGTIPTTYSVLCPPSNQALASYSLNEKGELRSLRSMEGLLLLGSVTLLSGLVLASNGIGDLINSKRNTKLFQREGIAVK